MLSVQNKSCISEPIVGHKAEVPLLNTQEKRRSNNNIGQLGKQGPKKEDPTSRKSSTAVTEHPTERYHQ